MNSAHLRQHNLTSKEFKKLYPEISFNNETSKKLRGEAKRLREQQYTLNPNKCKQCMGIIPYNAALQKRWSAVNRSNTGNIFCSKSCAATYNNTHKTHGCRRSKLECFLETKLTELYPTLEMHFNKKNEINSELDIYIPSLRLAFELNGIYHYEPIHGTDKLSQIQNNDSRKFQACLERNIELCIIDTSRLTYFKETNAKPFLDVIQKIITLKAQVNN